MNLTNNMTVSNTSGAGQFCWGRNGMHRQKGEIYIAWESGRYGSERIFRQYLLWESKFRNV